MVSIHRLSANESIRYGTYRPQRLFCYEIACSSDNYEEAAWEVWCISRFHEGLMFPKLSERFGKFRNHSVDFIILHSISGQEYHITDKYIPKMTLLARNHMHKLYKRATDRRNFPKDSESFGNRNPSWKRQLFFYGQDTNCYTAQRHKNNILAYKICSERYS